MSKLHVEVSPQPETELRSMFRVGIHHRSRDREKSMSELQKQTRIANLREAHAAIRGKTHCPNGHLYTAENTRMVESWRAGAAPSRQCRTCQRQRKNKRLPTASKTSAALTALEEGRTLNSLYGRRGDTFVGGSIFKPVEFANLCRAKPRIGKQMKALALKNRVAAAASFRLYAAPAILRNDGRDAYGAVMAATAGLWEGHRAEIIGQLWLDLAEGRVAISGIPTRVKELRTAQNRADKHSVFSRYGHLSLAMPLSSDGGVAFTLGDTFAEDRALWRSE